MTLYGRKKNFDEIKKQEKANNSLSYRSEAIKNLTDNYNLLDIRDIF